MKRKLLSFLCILLSIVFLGTACTKNDVSTPSGGTSDSIDTGSDSGEDTNESEYDLVRGEGQKKLTIYYSRAAGYENCDIWLWHAEAEGRGNLLHPCEYGAKMVVLLPSTIDEVGFIIRTNIIFLRQPTQVMKGLPVPIIITSADFLIICLT